VANEINFTASISAFKPMVMSSAIGRSISGLVISMTNDQYIQGSVLIGLAATAFPLAQVGAPHWCYLRNLDPTNYVTVGVGAGGAVPGSALIQLNPGEPAFFPLSVAAAPYGLANTAACWCEYLILAL